MWDVIVVGARTAGHRSRCCSPEQGCVSSWWTGRRFRAIRSPRTRCRSRPLRRSMGTPRHHRSCDSATAQIRLDAGGAVVAGRCPSYGGINAMYSPRRTLLDAVLVDAAPPEQKSGKGSP